MATGIPASAATLLSVTGPTSGSSGIGLEGTPGDEEAGAVQFTTTGFSNATVSVQLEGLSQSQTISAWITNQIGPGTTTPTNVLASTTFAGPAFADTLENAFTGLTLGAGTYYLVLSALLAPNDTGWDLTKNPPTVTGTPENSYVQSWGNSGVSGPFAPAGVISQISTDPNDDNFIFSITTSSPTPLPAALPLFVTGLGAMGLLARRRKRKVAVAA